MCFFAGWTNLRMFLSSDTKEEILSLTSRHQFDPYWIRNHPPKFTLEDSKNRSLCSVPPGVGEEGPAGIRGLFKLRTAITTRTRYPLENRQESGLAKNNVKLLCMVYTHSNRHDTLQSIVETYAPQCDGFLAASNVSDPNLGAVRIPHVGPESYQNMWNKVRSMWQYVHDDPHFQDFDWFHIGGDDMYVLPHHLRMIASQQEPTPNRRHQPIYMGASIPHPHNPKRRYCGGGAGYSLNRRAVQLLVEQLFPTEPACFAAMASDEDVRMARCLQDGLGIQCSDTNDADGEVRYHHLDIHFHSAWVPTRPSLWHWEKLQYFHNISGSQKQLAQISNTSISFHLDKSTVRSLSPDRGIRRYHAILYGLCGSDFDHQVQWAATCNTEQRLQLRRQWELIPKVG